MAVGIFRILSWRKKSVSSNATIYRLVKSLERERKIISNRANTVQ